ncbi:MAG: gliding motility-associated ABC transporter permease subunit GldF [Salibacteraceae bacterium]
MFTLLRKEISSFLSSLTGYLVIAVFLSAVGIIMWLFPGYLNVLDSGYSTIDTLFIVAPWVFLFLGPAITMRSFSEEKRTGTLELLVTRPLSDWQIVLAKYFAGFLLVVFSLLPTLVYYYSVSNLGATPGNIDSGGTWGSYIGLLFLAGAFVAIGLFASSLTESQIISFILAVIISFVCYYGFEALGALGIMGSFDHLVIKLGINDHYLSMSRGVIDSRDVLYYFSLIFLFLLFTKTRLQSRKW